MSDFEAAKTEILEWVSDAIEVPVDQIDHDKPLAEVGLDSLDAVHLVAMVESIIRQDLPEDVIQQVKSLNDVFKLMRDRSGEAA